MGGCTSSHGEDDNNTIVSSKYKLQNKSFCLWNPRPAKRKSSSKSAGAGHTNGGERKKTSKTTNDYYFECSEAQTARQSCVSAMTEYSLISSWDDNTDAAGVMIGRRSSNQSRAGSCSSANFLTRHNVVIKPGELPKSEPRRRSHTDIKNGTFSKIAETNTKTTISTTPIKFYSNAGGSSSVLQYSTALSRKRSHDSSNPADYNMNCFQDIKEDGEDVLEDGEDVLEDGEDNENDKDDKEESEDGTRDSEDRDNESKDKDREDQRKETFRREEVLKRRDNEENEDYEKKDKKDSENEKKENITHINEKEDNVKTHKSPEGKDIMGKDNTTFTLDRDSTD